MDLKILEITHIEYKNVFRSNCPQRDKRIGFQFVFFLIYAKTRKHALQNSLSDLRISMKRLGIWRTLMCIMMTLTIGRKKIEKVLHTGLGKKIIFNKN